MLRYADVVNIQSVGYDKYNATQWAIDSTEQGLPLEEYPQTLGNFNMPTKRTGKADYYLVRQLLITMK